MEELQWQGDCMCWHVCPPPAAVDQADKGDERLRALLRRFDDAATDYINAVVAMSDPTAPHTEKARRDEKGRALDALLGVITDHRASPPQPAPELDVDRLADVLHAKVCGPFATIDPQECVAGRARDVRLAEAIAAEYARLSQEGDTGS